MFYDPRSKQTFKYDHLRKEAQDFGQWQAEPKVESWRQALESEFDTYVKNHFRQGVMSVFGKWESGQTTLVVCIEDHQFQPKNYWYIPLHSIMNINV